MMQPRNRIAKASPSEILFRSGEALRTILERVGYRPGVDAFRAYLEKSLAAVPSIPFASFRERERVCRFLREHFPSSVGDTVKKADEVLSNRIPIFSDVVDYGETIDWHRDYISGKRAPLTFYRNAESGGERIGDLKNIWELNRHNFLLHLGKAALLTGERKYFTKWKDIILSWMNENPYNHGVNWSSSLEIAMRVINWIWSSYFFSDELADESDLRSSFFIFMYYHGIHIHNHLSYYFSPNTHLTGEALGLLYLSRTFPGFERARVWETTARSILENEISRQVLDDGGYFEMTTYYHKYTIDFYIHYLLLEGAASGPKRPIAARIKKSIRHLALISDPAGMFPLIGDSDGGALLTLGPCKRSVQGSCCTGAVALNDGELKHLCNSEFQEETLWFLGVDGYERFNELEETEINSYCTFNANTGLYGFRRGITDDDQFLLIDCGPHGWGRCGHAHADLLSFVWFSGGEPVIVDPGTYTYQLSKPMRNGCRVSSSHNTITINGISQSVPDGAFSWKRIAQPLYAFARFNENFGYFEGEHDAYHHFGCRHIRSVIFHENELCAVFDFLRFEKTIDTLLYNLQFDEGRLERHERNLFEFTGAKKRGSHFIKLIATTDFAGVIKDSAVYPDYNYAVPASKLVVLKEHIAGDVIVAAVLGGDRALVDSFEFAGDGHIEGFSQLSSYCIAFGTQDLAGGGGDATALQISASIQHPHEELLFIRNGNSACSRERNIRLEMDGTSQYIVVRVKDTALHMYSDDSVRSFSVPFDIDELRVNGMPARFSRAGKRIIMESGGKTAQ